jgi:TolB-like protein/class 3 adenylate cyclase
MDRRLAAILIADVVGYSALSRIDEEGTRARFRKLVSDIAEPAIADGQGRLVKTMGDALLVEFPSVVKALRCAIQIQQSSALTDGNREEQAPLRLRIGINLGDVIVEGADLQGDGVNLAARLQGLAEPGGIVLSAGAYDQVRKKVDVVFKDLGARRFKNIDDPIRAYAVVLGPRSAKIKRRPPLASRWSGLVLVALAVAAAAWLWLEVQRPAAKSVAVAVLPFQNLSGDPSNERMADGLTEDIITDLSRYWDFSVIARNSTLPYKGKPADVRQIGRDLGADYVLEGSFQRDTDKVRVTAQLIDAPSGRHVWSERFDRPDTDVFAIQSELADKIANSLGGSNGNIPGHVLTSAKRKPPSDLGSYELYLLGRDKIQGQTLDDQKKATELFEQAIRLDPTFARPHVALVWNYVWRMTMDPDGAPYLKLMLEHARRGIDLDPMDADAHEALGFALGLSGDQPQAEIQFDEALRLNPHSFDILNVYSCWANSFGKAEAGAAAADKAIRLNPNYPNWATACFRVGYAMVGRYEDVIKVSMRQPEEQWNTDAFVMTAGSLAMLGRDAEARALAARGQQRYPGLLSIERFALNRNWAASSSRAVEQLMRKAGFPPCADPESLKSLEKPVRLPECAKEDTPSGKGP